MIRTSAEAAMLEALVNQPPIVGYLVDTEGRTVGGPTVARSARVSEDGRSVTVDIDVRAYGPGDFGSLRLYDRRGCLMDFPFEHVEAGWSVSPPTIGLSSS